MSSPIPDDYVALMSPWKPLAGPLAEAAIKNAISAHNRAETGHNSKDKDVIRTGSIDANISGNDNNTQREDVEVTETDSIDVNALVRNRAQEEVSMMEGSQNPDIDRTDLDGSIDDGAEIDAADITDTENDPPQHIDTKCVAVSTCVANSGDHRKVVSHIFGRNKACTRDLPDNLWIYWCRKHYQRFKYRAEDAENWHTIQMGLVRNQLQAFEDWGEVRSWTISLRKAEQDAITKENQNGVTYTSYVTSCWERFLLPYLGTNKTFAQVREVLNVIDRKFNEAEYRNRDKKLKIFPGIEFLPTRQKAKEVKKPIVKKGEVVYKKITLDKPAFIRKTRANSDASFTKKRKTSPTDNASDASSTKKRKTSSTDNASDSSSTKKRKTSSTDNASDPSFTKKRKASPADITTNNINLHRRKSVNNTTVNPQSFQRTPILAKRRHLIRGYEKHGLEYEDSIFAESPECEDTTFTEKSDDDDTTFLDVRNK